MRLVALFVLAMAVRLVHVWSIRDSPLFDTLLGDARGYDRWARELAGGNWVGTEVFYQAPLYPYFLGVIYAVAARDLLVVRVVQALLGALGTVLLASAAERLFSRRVGIAAGVGLALYAPAIFFDALLQKTTLDAFLVCLSVWIASRIIGGNAAAATWLALGATLGALSLTRENALALIAVGVVWAVVAGRGRPRELATPGVAAQAERSRPRGRRGQAAVSTHTAATWRVDPRPVVALLAGLAITLAPVVVRNYTISGGVYLTTSQFGPNFFIGNNSAADGTYMSLRPGRGAPEFERRDATTLAEVAMGRPLTPSEVSRYWTDRALDFITGEPLAWARLMGRKALLLVNAHEMLDTESQEMYEDRSPLLRVLASVTHFGVLIPLSVLGMAMAWRDRRRLWPLYAMVAIYALSVVGFFVFARYRFPLVPWLMLFAAFGIVHLRDWFVVATSLQRTRRLAALAAVTAVVYWPLLSSTRMRAISETNLAVALHEDGRHEQAIEHYRRAITLQPDYAPAYSNLGVTLRSIGRVDEAIATYETGLRLAGGSPDLHYNLGNALLQQQRATEAARHLSLARAGEPQSAAAHNNLGMALAEKGNYDGAIDAFRAAVAAEPHAAGTALRNLGNLLGSLGRTDEARRALEQAIALDSSDAAALYDLGSLLLEMNDYRGAAERFHAALAADPQHVEAMNNLGIALASQGRIREAVPLFERALTLKPGYEDAQRNLETARAALRHRPPALQ
jgi:tetratricopeptide (TPR) repeat protein